MTPAPLLMASGTVKVWLWFGGRGLKRSVLNCQRSAERLIGGWGFFFVVYHGARISTLKVSSTFTLIVPPLKGNK